MKFRHMIWSFKKHFCFLRVKSSIDLRINILLQNIVKLIHGYFGPKLSQINIIGSLPILRWQNHLLN